MLNRVLQCQYATLALCLIPVCDYAMLNRVLQCQYATLALCLIANIAVLLVHANHDAWHFGPAHDGREDGARRIIASKSGLAHAAAIVHHEGRDLFFSHIALKS